MDFIALFTLAIIVITFLMSYQGLKDRHFFKKYYFNVDRLLIYKEYYRFFSVGLLHNDYIHLLFNMATLFSFGSIVEQELGGGQLLLIYLISLLGGSLFTLYVYRNDPLYTAVGASGAVCGILFAALAAIPNLTVSFMGLNSGIPGWLYGVLYVLYCVYGIRAKSGNVCHEGHFGGALCGLLICVACNIHLAEENGVMILLIIIPCVIFIYMILTRPYMLFLGDIVEDKRKLEIDERDNLTRAEKRKEVDRILEKISRRGINSLSQQEKSFLDENRHLI